MPDDTFAEIAVGGGSVCGLTSFGEIKCWGHPGTDGDAGHYNQPGAVLSAIFMEVEAGENHTCALRHDETLACWGSDDYPEVLEPTLLDP